MKKKSIDRRIVIAAAVILLIVVLLMARTKRMDAANPDIETDTVKRGMVTSSVSGNGVLEPLTTVEVRSNVGGQIVELAVDEGDTVKAGQLIAKIDPSDSISNLDQARAEFSSANAKVAQSKQALNMQRLQTVASIEGTEQAVEASRQRLGQAEEEASVQPRLTAESIAQAASSLESAEANLKQTESALSPQKIATAKANYDQAKASFDDADRRYKRQQALLGKGFVSQSQMDTAEAQYTAAKAQFDSARNKLDTIHDESEQDLRNARSKVAQAKSALASAQANRVQDSLKQKELAAARASYRQAQASLSTTRAAAYQDQMKSEELLQSVAQLQKSRAAVRNATTQLGYTTIVAPRSGVVVKKYVEKGSIVTGGKQAIGGGGGSGITIVDIADTTRMQILVDVDETDVAKIELGQEVDVNVDALPDELFTGKVTKIAPQAEVDQNVTTVAVTVELELPDQRLKPQMNATCDFIIDRKDNVLYVPVEAISETDSGTEVTVVAQARQTVRKVEIGISGDDYCEIVSNLREGETILIPEEETTGKSSNRGPGGPPGPPPM